MLLFVEPHTAGARLSEAYLNPDVTKVSVTVNGSPNRLYNNGLEGIDVWEEVKRFFLKPINKTQHMNATNLQIYGPFRGKFDYIVLICPTFAHNKTYHRIGENDPRMFVIICKQHEVEIFWKVVSWLFEGTDTLIILDDCAASKDVKGRTGQLVNLGFSARHIGISVWVLTQKITSITPSFRENVAAIVLFILPRSKPRRRYLMITPANSPTMSTKI